MQGRCRGQTRAGEPCNAQPRPGREWCAWHDPQLAGDQTAWRAKGGAERSNARRATKTLPKDLADVRDALLGALQKLETGELRPQTAQAMASLARALVALHEAGQFERQLAALESSPEWRDMRARIVTALAPYPAARAALAEVLSAGG